MVRGKGYLWSVMLDITVGFFKMNNGELLCKLNKLAPESKASLGLQFANFALGEMVEFHST